VRVVGHDVENGNPSSINSFSPCLAADENGISNVFPDKKDRIFEKQNSGNSLPGSSIPTKGAECYCRGILPQFSGTYLLSKSV
jgi:hypothetical protein